MPFPTTRPGWFGGSAAALVLLTGAVVLLLHGDLRRIGDPPLFLAGAGVMLIGFFAGLARKNVPWLLVLTVAVLARLLLLFQEPGTDIFRYIWEGRLLLSGVNPYLHPPDAMEFLSFRDAHWEMMEHREFTAIYPPLTECCFALMAGISPTVLAFKVLFAACDLLAGGLLWRRFGSQSAIFYLWNPLVIYSFAGGGHFDSLFVLALVVGWLSWDAGKLRQAVVWIGVAVAVKWMALPILGWAGWQLFRKSGFRAAATSLLLSGVPMGAAWLAIGFWSQEWTLHLYPEKFTEWARSADLIPGIVANWWPESRFNNTWFVPPVLLAWTLVIFRARRFTGAAEWSIFFSLIFSPLVHGWYFTWIIPFAVETRNRGTLLLAASAFVYFMVYQRYVTQLEWHFSPLETVLLWAPFVLGFLWQARAKSITPAMTTPRITP